MNCKKCGAELDDNARFCPQCGALQPLICPECGAESRPGSRVCSSCGKKLPVAVHDEPLVDYPKRKKYTTNKVAITAIAVGAVLLLAGAVLFLTKTLGGIDEKPNQPIDPPSQTEPKDPQKFEPIPEPKPEPKPGEEDKKPGEEDKKPGEEDKKPGEEDKKPGEDDKTPTEDEKKPGEDDKTPTEDDKKPDTKPEEPAKPEPKPEEPPKTEQKPDNSEWIFPDSSERRLTDADIAGMSKAQLRLARNEIYARHGRIFRAQDLKDYFNSRTWYNGTVAPNNFKEDTLNEVERANVNFLKAAE